MRVLFTAWGWPSHLYALVPLAWACRSAGHEVLIAVQPAVLDEAVCTGLPAAAVGVHTDGVGMVRGYLLPSLAAGPGGAAPRAGKGPRALQMFLAHADAMLDELTELAREWRADVVVYEPTAFAGPVAAAAAGVPAVRHLYGVDLLSRAAALLPALLEPLAARVGVTHPVDPATHPTIDPVPPALRLPSSVTDPVAVAPMRHVPYAGAARHRVDRPRHGDRPVVCVTWGHTMGRLDGDRCLSGTVAAAVAGADVDVVAVVTGEQARRLGPVPGGVRVVVDARLEQVVADADLVVAHGGAGTTLTALGHGVPLLLVPQLPDHAGHAARVLAAGAGEVLTRDEADPARLHAEVRRLLADDGVLAAARRLRDEIRSAPTPAEVATRLPGLAALAQETSVREPVS